MKPSARILTAAAASVVALGGGAVALASSSSAAPHIVTACTKGNVPLHIYSGSKAHSCPKGEVRVAWNQEGPKGATGAAGKTGVVATSNTQLVKSTDPSYSASAGGDVVNTGGSFTSRATDLATTLKLPAGTYLISVNFTATPDATTGGDVLPQMMVYDGPVNASFTNDLFNVGSGAIENPTAAILSSGDLINSYFSGSAEIKVPSGGETLNFYAFGYDSDQGAGTYVLNSAVVTATQLQVSGS